MEFSEEASSFLTRIQQLGFAVDDKTSDPSMLTDCYRNLYLDISQSYQPDKSHRSTHCKPHLISEAQVNLDKYADIVDKLDETGLNNFAEGALALSDYHLNESTKWETTLSVDKILKMAVNTERKETEEDASDDFLITLHNPTKHSSLCATESAPFKKNTGSEGSLPNGPERKNQFSNSNQFSALNTTTSTNSPTIPHLNSATKGQLFSTENSTSSFTTGCFNPGTKRPFFPEQTSGAVTKVFPATNNTSTYGSFQSNTNRPFVPELNGAESKMHPSANNISTNGSFQFERRANWQQRGQGDQSSNLGSAGPVKEFDVNSRDVNKSTYNKMGRQTGNRPWRKRDKDDDEEEETGNGRLPFKTAKQQLVINQQKKYGNSNMGERTQVVGSNYGANKKSLGTRRGPASKFVPPILNRDSDEYENPVGQKHGSRQRGGDKDDDSEEPVDERLKGIDPKMIELIKNEIMDNGPQMTWSDIAGLEFAKKTIKEIVVWPMLRPDIFTGLRGPPKGLLLFGPPGTGKTLIGKCIASQSKSTFFCISASSLTSKWVGEGEKMVRALFAVARCNQPAVVFIDEIDSLLSQRSETEHESSRRIKTEFLVQLDGAATESEDRILIIGATNRPQEIDEAARRRFVKRLLIPLPESVARCVIVKNLMSQQKHDLSESDIQAICDRTDGYSGADMTNLCREAALGPIRSIPFELMETITPDQVRPILYQDFESALLQVRASVSQKDLLLYTDWNKTYGSFGQ